ncbi:hypothetical protein D7X98_07280 [bacterium 1XD8-76]|nr:hypothetical protein D7X98_07280 [bacterium 1XD8-76]
MKSIKNIWKKRWRKNMAAAAVTVALLAGGAALPGATVRAEGEAPFVDISTDLISLSPQADEVKMNVAARNMPEGTKLAFSVADAGICSVEWTELDSRGYTQLCYRRGTALGETVVTVFVNDNPAVASQIRVTNRDVADSYVYEGDGSMNIHGLNMPPVPYDVHVLSTDADGYFGLLCSNAAGETKMLVNKTGAYEGSTTIEKGANATSLQILASGHWQIVMTPVLNFTTMTQSGAGNMVSGRFKGDDGTHDVYCANWAEKGNYIVWLYDLNNDTRQLLANGVGTYGKKKKNIYLNDSHSYYLSVQSEGKWLVEFQ